MIILTGIVCVLSKNKICHLLWLEQKPMINLLLCRWDLGAGLTISFSSIEKLEVAGDNTFFILSTNTSTQQPRTKNYFSSTQPMQDTRRDAVGSHDDHDNFDNGSYPPMLSHWIDMWHILSHPAGVAWDKLKHLLLWWRMFLPFKHSMQNPYQLVLQIWCHCCCRHPWQWWQ